LNAELVIPLFQRLVPRMIGPGTSSSSIAHLATTMILLPSSLLLMMTPFETFSPPTLPMNSKSSPF
ncbi:hypothetical protein CCACVL1_23311, partial [Corchorus capsularis]